MRDSLSPAAADLPRLDGALPPGWLINRTPRRPQAMSPIDIDMIKREAHAQGEAAGIASGRQKVEAILARYAEAIERLNVASHAMSSLAVSTVVDLTMAVAREIVGHEVSIDKDLVAHAVEDAIAQIGSARRIRVRLGTADLAFFKARRPDLVEGGLDLIEDSSLGIGACVIEHAGDC